MDRNDTVGLSCEQNAKANRKRERRTSPAAANEKTIRFDSEIEGSQNIVIKRAAAATVAAAACDNSTVQNAEEDPCNEEVNDGYELVVHQKRNLLWAATDRAKETLDVPGRHRERNESTRTFETAS